MEDTACGEDCCFVKSGFCNNETECPNFTETIWQEGNSGKIKNVKDCSPKRTVIEQQRIINCVVACQGSVQVLRDKIENLETLLLNLINQSRSAFCEIEEATQINKLKSEIKKIEEGKSND